MSGETILRRIERLQAIYAPPQKCGTCFDHPVRIRSEVEETGEVISDNYPDDQCPACGRPVWSTRIYIGIDALEV